MSSVKELKEEIESLKKTLEATERGRNGALKRSNELYNECERLKIRVVQITRINNGAFSNSITDSDLRNELGRVKSDLVKAQLQAAEYRDKANRYDRMTRPGGFIDKQKDHIGKLEADRLKLRKDVESIGKSAADYGLQIRNLLSETNILYKNNEILEKRNADLNNTLDEIENCSKMKYTLWTKKWLKDNAPHKAAMSDEIVREAEELVRELKVDTSANVVFLRDIIGILSQMVAALK